MTERRSAAAPALIWLAGNTGGIVVAVIVQALNRSPSAAFGAPGGDCRKPCWPFA